MTTQRWIWTLALASLLGACGGGGGDAPVAAADPGVPATATASPEAFSAYVGSLPADARAEPLALGKLVPPTSETAEPIGVN